MDFKIFTNKNLKNGVFVPQYLVKSYFAVTAGGLHCVFTYSVRLNPNP